LIDSAYFKITEMSRRDHPYARGGYSGRSSDRGEHNNFAYHIT